MYEPKGKKRNNGLVFSPTEYLFFFRRHKPRDVVLKLHIEVSTQKVVKVKAHERIINGKTVKVRSHYRAIEG